MQMVAGLLRFVCMNGMVCGETVTDVRVRRKGQIVDNVTEGAFEVLDGFKLVREVRDDMRAITLAPAGAAAFGRAALALKYEPDATKPAPITETQLLAPRRTADAGSDLWSTFNRVQENIVQGRLTMKSTESRRTSTRAVAGIDSSVKVNRALWMLAEEMRRLKA
jgi:hypothetical protein